MTIKPILALFLMLALFSSALTAILYLFRRNKMERRSLLLSMFWSAIATFATYAFADFGIFVLILHFAFVIAWIFIANAKNSMSWLLGPFIYSGLALTVTAMQIATFGKPQQPIFYLPMPLAFPLALFYM